MRRTASPHATSLVVRLSAALLLMAPGAHAASYTVTPITIPGFAPAPSDNSRLGAALISLNNAGQISGWIYGQFSNFWRAPSRFFTGMGTNATETAFSSPTGACAGINANGLFAMDSTGGVYGIYHFSSNFIDPLHPPPPPTFFRYKAGVFDSCFVAPIDFNAIGVSDPGQILFGPRPNWNGAPNGGVPYVLYASASATATQTPIAVPGASWTSPTTLTANGYIAGTFAYPGGATRAFRWTPSHGYQHINIPGAPLQSIGGSRVGNVIVNSKAHTAGYYVDTAGQTHFWLAAGTNAHFLTFPAGAQVMSLSAINSSDRIAGTLHDTAGYHAFVMGPAGFISIGTWDYGEDFNGIVGFNDSGTLAFNYSIPGTVNQAVGIATCSGKGC